MRRVLALIAARAGSQGLRDKNIRPLGGVPLLVRAIRLAQRSRARGEQWTVVVSTDSRRYATLARRAGARVLSRPRHLATGRARLIDALLHAIDALESQGEQFDSVVLLSATTPLTRPADVRRAVALHRRRRVSVASVTADEVPESWRFRLASGRLTGPRARVEQRQSAIGGVRLNGAVYVATPAWLRRHHQFLVTGRTAALVMPRQRSVDIDDAQDLAWAEWLMSKHGGR